ncbi:hypothetical protein VCHENC02_0338B, partial [Vibrio harveyi]
YNQNDALG